MSWSVGTFTIGGIYTWCMHSLSVGVGGSEAKAWKLKREKKGFCSWIDVTKFSLFEFMGCRVCVCVCKFFVVVVIVLVVVVVDFDNDKRFIVL